MATPTSSINSEVIKTPLFPDTIMIREALCGFSKRGPTNITVFWPLEFRRGEFSLPLCQKTISILLKNHPNLQTSFQVQESVVKWFRLDPPLVPITEYQDDGTPNFWRSMVKSEVRKPFDDPSLPAWRVAVAQGNEKKLLVAITILHALGDGVCLGQLAVQFNETMARLIAGMNPILPSPGEYPSLETLYQKYPSTALTTKSPTPPPLTFHPCQTGFAKRLFSKSPDLVENLSRFCKQQCPPIKIHSTLVAALILAVKKVVNPSFKTLDALTIVSFRDALGVPKSQFRPLFSWLKVEEVDPTQSFQEIALFVHKKLHAQLEAGQHVENLRTTEAQLALNPTAEELISQIQVPPNLVNVTNRQELGSSGNYPETAPTDPVLIMPEIYGVGGNGPYFGVQGPGSNGITVGMTTFKKILNATASVIEDEKIGLGEKTADAILEAQEDILIANCKPTLHPVE